MDDKGVEWSLEVLHLRLLFDDKLLFRLHVDKTMVKCSALIRSLYPIICRRSRLTRVNKLAVFKQIIAPAIFYATPVRKTNFSWHRIVHLK